MNEELKATYDRAYKEGDFFTKGRGVQERAEIIKMLPSFKEMKILEIGAGKGELANSIRKLGYEITAIDYSEECGDGVLCKNYREITDKFDVIVMLGVLEHLDEPFVELDWMINNLLNKNGQVITSSPNFLNPRGYVWMTLHHLLKVPMSLTDLHFIAPWDFGRYCNVRGYRLIMQSVDQDWGCGKMMLDDYYKRLPKALNDVGLPTDGCKSLWNWLKKSNNYFQTSRHSGANMVYKIFT